MDRERYKTGERTLRGWTGLAGSGVLLAAIGMQAQTQAPTTGDPAPAGSQATPAPITAAPAGSTPTTDGRVSNAGATTRADEKAKEQRALKAEEAQEAVPAPTTAGVLLDHVVAVVNGDVVLESDVEEERRLAAFQPITGPEANATRERSIERLINRRLLLQQSKLQPQQPITEADIDKEMDLLRREIPACKAAHCETEAGWSKFLAAHDVTINELRAHWRDRMEALRFIELRFRSGIRISPAEIKDYFDKTMLPQYAKQHVKPPPLDKVSDRIQEVLLQQQVTGLLDDWLKSLRAQGTVQVVADGANPS